MFKEISKLNHKLSSYKYTTISKAELIDGVNSLDNFIILKSDDKFTIYDRNCDHMGGKIITRNNIHECPVHKWRFDALKGKYTNGFKKKRIKDFEIKNKKIIVREKKITPTITQIINKNNKGRVKIRFINHACLTVEAEDFKFATDPWAIGPAFNTGWWLKYKSKEDWIEEINSCSFIYISHNHPDHLHPLTLSKIDKKIPIIVPNFISGATFKFIEELGFKRIIKLDFAKEYRFKQTNLIISILKSGDFREDSGIYFSIGKFTALFDVDSNMINFNKIPNVDFYASSFAGGSSGYPLCFENYTDKEKNEIILKSKNFLKFKKIKIFNEAKIKYFLPYAGFFQEKLHRDKKIFKFNKKNTIEDYELIAKKSKFKILNIEKFDEFYFENKKLVKSSNNKNKFYKDLDKETYLNYFKNSYSNIDVDYIKEYFLNSNFNDNLTLFIRLTDDNFKKNFLSIKINFNNDTSFEILKNFKISKGKETDSKVIYMLCRKESFLNTLYNKCSWEDLSIGFQCRITRYPNLYNAKFWNHFTNNYVLEKNIKVNKECNSCESIKQFFDNQIQSIT